MTTTKDGVVCGLVSKDLVRKIVGDAAISTRGSGVVSARERSVTPASCRVRDDGRGVAVMQISIGEVKDPASWRRTLADEAEGKTGCRDYSGDPGVGYGCTYENGVFRDGAAVNVLHDDQLLRVTVYNWTDATPEERRSLAEAVARDVVSNVSDYDRDHGNG